LNIKALTVSLPLKSKLPADVLAAREPHGLSADPSRLGIDDFTRLNISTARETIDALILTEEQESIAGPIVREVGARLGFLASVGLEYLSLSRKTATLSGGEAQRIRLASQVGSGIVGATYVLDEPTIGLHARDNARLIRTLRHLSDIGNTVLVVEHDEEMIRAADHVIDIGPGPGVHGGTVVAQGSVETLCEEPASLTGLYLSRARTIPVPSSRRSVSEKFALTIRGARQHNLQSVDIAFPIGGLVCVTGVSGSGKSTLVNDILLRSVELHMGLKRSLPGEHDAVEGLEAIDRVIEVDQTPIGRTPRSNPATYTGMFDEIRKLFALTPDARVRGYKAGRFSFNVKGGRCEVCQGQGVRKIAMHFLPDVFVTCETCDGQRYNADTLEVKYRDHSIAQVLAMTVEEACSFFEFHRKLKRMSECLFDVGLGYLTIGQRSTTLSGGEAQRVKLATELGKGQARRGGGHTLYILDEPTTGLHFDDVSKLVHVLQALTDQGNTIVVIEHNLDVIKSADWIVDLGPDGGDGGGRVVASGPPERVAEVEESYTAHYLREILETS
jgi:excinuclease ABC subunit A